MLIRTFFAVSTLWVTLAASGVSADNEPATNKVSKLRADLTEIQKSQLAVQEELNATTRELQTREHDLSYSDPEAARIREEVKVLERKMIELRRLLRERLRMVDDIRNLEEQRKQLYLRLQKLKELEMLTLKELEALIN